MRRSHLPPVYLMCIWVHGGERLEDTAVTAKGAAAALIAPSTSFPYAFNLWNKKAIKAICSRAVRAVCMCQSGDFSATSAALKLDQWVGEPGLLPHRDRGGELQKSSRQLTSQHITQAQNNSSASFSLWCKDLTMSQWWRAFYSSTLIITWSDFVVLLDLLDFFSFSHFEEVLRKINKVKYNLQHRHKYLIFNNMRIKTKCMNHYI